MNRRCEPAVADTPTRRRILRAAGVLGAGLLAGCAGDGGGATGEDGAAWRRTELTDVLTDEPFSIAGLSGPVVVQSFAVWCPKCQRQSEELAKAGESLTLVGLNIDPNEDAQKVREHAQRNGFDWRFAVAPTTMTESLVEQFGSAVTNAPSTPIIVACEDGSVEFFSGSQQSIEQIRSAAGDC